MAVFKRFRSRKNGLVSYRQEGSTVSIYFPATAFTGEAPETIEVGAEGLVAPGTRGTTSRDPLLDEVRKIKADTQARLQEIRDQRKAAREAKLAAMTPEQRAKHDASLAKMKERLRAKREAAKTAAQTEAA